MSRLLVINQYYAPGFASTGRLAAEICSGLAQRGIDVHVVTGQPSYTADSPDAPEYEVLDGVHVHRIPLCKGREKLIMRIVGYLRFLIGAKRKACQLLAGQEFDCVLTFHNPPFVGLIGASLAKKHNLRFTYAPYDIHPDILLATRWIPMPKPIAWCWDRVNKRILAQAQAVVALGDGMKQTIVGKKVEEDKVHVVPLWGRPEIHPDTKYNGLRRELGISDEEVLLLYSGNMGIMHPLEEIVDAAEQLQGAPVRFLFVGDGAKRKKLTELAAEMPNVMFLPFQSEERFQKLVCAADACIVVLEPGLEKLAVPSRSFTFLSAGRPLLTMMSPEADVARLVTETGCGWNAEDSDGIVGTIRTLLADRTVLDTASDAALKTYTERFDRERIIGQYADIIAA